MSAHAFLVGTSPAQGERLSASPGVIVFEFSESVDPVSVAVEVRTAGGGPVATGEPEVTSGGLEVRVDVAELPTDTYVVTWAVSALDGHGSGGEFAFAVGNAGGSIPGASVRSPSLLGVGAAVLFFVGLAIAMGTLVLRWRRADDGAMVTRAGLAVSAIGVVVMLLASDGERLLLLLCLQSLLVALVLVGLERGRALLCGVPVLIAAGLWSARGHVASQRGVVGWGVDVVHLVAGAAWLGSLALTARGGWRVRRQREQLIRRVRAYSRVVPVFVVVLSSAGVLASVLVLPSWRSLYETGYGRLLILKMSMLLAALLLAGAARW